MIQEDFSQDTEKVAKDLLGTVIKKDGMKGMIVETEAYLEDDPASHAHPERTERNRLMYETCGKVYVYVCYGIHYMLNFTTEEQNAGAVLVRAAEPLEGIGKMKENRGVEDKAELCNGPGKLCEALGIDKNLNGSKVGEKISLKNKGSTDFNTSTRISISKAKNRKLRYLVPDNLHVSNQ